MKSLIKVAAAFFHPGWALPGRRSWKKSSHWRRSYHGRVRVLEKEMTVGHIIIVSSAVRDEGM
jgi:hypothetical protein